MRRFSGRAAFMVGVTAIVGSMLWSETSSAATIEFTVDLSWSATTPACDGASTIVCSGVGSTQLTSGMQVDPGSLPTTLTLQPVADQISQEDDDPVRIGILRYCNGETADGTDIENATLLADFDIPGVGSGQATDVATLLLTINDPEDPVASADTLYLATDPSRSHAVKENECLDIELLGKVTVEPDLTVILGPVIPPTPSSTTTTTPGATTTTTTTAPGGPTSTTTTTIDGGEDPALCPPAYYGKCAPEIRTDWNCPDAGNNALPADWRNVPVNPDIPPAQQDPWGLDGDKGPEFDGRQNVGCESTTTTTSASNVRSATTVARSSGSASANGTSSSGNGASGLAATGGNAGPLALMALGLVLLGGSASQTQIGRRWYATADNRVRYTIDSKRRIR